MGLFDDINRFLEDRLDEFLRNNPHLELQAIEEQLREQEQDTQKLIAELQHKETSLQQEIMDIAEKIQTWHGRVSKAQAANRPDLAEAAKEREAALLRQGNQVWGQMEGIKQRILQSKQLLEQIKQRRQEVKTKFAEQAVSDRQKTSNQNANYNSYTTGWEKNFSNTTYNKALDPLEAEFQKWELDDELERMKRNMGKG